MSSVMKKMLSIFLDLKTVELVDDFFVSICIKLQKTQWFSALILNDFNHFIFCPKNVPF